MPKLTESTAAELDRLTPAARQEVAALLSPLTPREREILPHVASGLTNREIGDLLYLSDQTVKNHVRNALRKTGASTRLELTIIAIHKGWIDCSRAAARIEERASRNRELAEYEW